MRLTMDEMTARARRAIGRIDARGPRGAEECSTEEVVAMACLLVASGVAPEPYAGPPSAGRHEERVQTTVRRALALAAMESRKKEGAA